MTEHVQVISAKTRKKTLSALCQEGAIQQGALDADYVRSLVTLGAFQQVELDGFALVQSAIAVLLDGGKMHEYIFPC
jgi:hypothetical protein